MRIRVLLFLMLASTALAQTPMRFEITLAPDLSAKPVSGRLLIFMTRHAAPGKVLEPDMLEPDKVWVEGIEVHDLEPGKTVEFAPTLAFPKPFSEAAPGDYQFMALLDVNHTYGYKTHAVGGDLHSELTEQRGFDPGKAGPVALVLTRRVPPRDFKDTATEKLVSIPSRALSRFWGRPVNIEAVVLLPEGYAKQPQRRYPAVYMIHGFEGDAIGSARGAAPMIARYVAEGRMPEMVWVFLNGQCSLGHHEFANSVNDGPWGDALTRELIPHLERTFRMDGGPRARLLTGHSSGGWSSLWLEIHYPDVFGGTWSTSPDPEDFRSFTDIDLLRGDNFYYDAGGKERNLVRYHGKNIMTMKQYVQLEQVLGDHGGQMQSFDAVFSPRGEDGRPMPVFDRATGELYPEVVKEWEEHWDIDHYLRENWKTLGAKLRGKIHVWVGTADNFHLDDSARLLDQTLKALHADAKVTFVGGRDHFDLYEGNDLFPTIVKQMYAVARGKQPSGAGRQSPTTAAKTVGGADAH